MITITIDCGASFLKGAIFDNGRLEKVIQYSSPCVHSDQNIFDVRQIFILINSVKKMILELAQGHKEINLCISNEMHGFLLAYQDGRPYTDYVSWQLEMGNIDMDGESAVSLLLSELDLESEILHTGMPLRGGLPSCNLLYLKRMRYLYMDGEHLYFYTLGDYLIRMLANQEPVVHPSNAAATGLYDLTAGAWNRKLITYVANNDVVFPDIGMRELIFSMDELRVHVLPAIGDQQAALLGAGVKEGDISFNMGTGAQVSQIVSKIVFGTGYQIRPFFDGSYLQTIPHIPSGRALNVYFRFVESILKQYGVIMSADEIYSGLLAAEQNAEDTELICDLSFFENAITDHIGGSISMIGEGVFTIGNLMRAVFSQMTDNFLSMADRIECDRDRIQRVVFSGGIARRMEGIRNRILAHYPGKDSVFAKNETMVGLYTYGCMYFEK